jgi:type I restriction enzyme S subunit
MTRLVALGDAIELAYGRGLPLKNRNGGDVPVYGSNGIVGWHDEPLVPSDTVIVGRKGSAGAVHLVEGASFPIDTTYYVRPRRGVDLDMGFAAYALKSLDLSRLRTSTGVPGLNREDAYREPFPLPPLEEQRRIVDILNRAASIRHLRDRANATLRALIPALFVKMFGDPAENPMGWDVRPLGDLLETPPRNGLSPSKAGSVVAPVLTLSAITRGTFDASAVKEGLFPGAVPPEQHVFQRRFLLCRGNGNLNLVGRGHFPPKDMPGVAFPDTIISVEINPTRLNPEFFEQLWSMQAVRGQIERAAKTTNGTYKINQKSLIEVELMVPPLDLQCKFAETTASAAACARLSGGANERTEALVNALTSNLLGTCT